MRPAHLARFLLLGLILAFHALSPPAAHASRDTLETGPGAFGVPVIASVAVGDLAPLHGVVHVAWTRDRQLRHAWSSFGPWQMEVVADSALSYDIAVKGDGLATLALADMSGRLIFAERSAGGWVLDTILTVPGASLRVSVAPYGEPAIAWTEVLTGNIAKLRHARRESGSWTITEVDDSVLANTPSLAIAGGTRPLIACARPAVNGILGVEMALYEGAGPNGPFASASVDTAGAGSSPSLAWDFGHQRPFVIYQARRESDFDLYRNYRVAWRDAAATWHRREIGTPESGVINAVSIALDPAGVVGALWARQGVLPPLSHAPEIDACPSNTVPHFSRQPAGVPAGPFDPAVPLPTGAGVDAIFGTRSIASHQFGTFDVCWREPRSACAPYAILYQELEFGTTAVSEEPIRPAIPFELAPTPRRDGDVVHLRWSQSRAAEVRLTAHDLAGRVVMSFAPGRLPAGDHEQAWRPDGLAPGIYWVSLRLDGERVAERTLVTR